MDPAELLPTIEEKLFAFFNQAASSSGYTQKTASSSNRNNQNAQTTFERSTINRSLEDLKAMSVASLYEVDGDGAIEMNTVRSDDTKSVASSANVNNDSNNTQTATMTEHLIEEPIQRNSVVSEECPCNPYGETPSVNNSLYFADGIRSVDFVVVWKTALEEETHLEEIREKKRFIYEQNLVRDGLELEREVIENEIHFIKIHAPLEVLRRYSEILKLRMPMKEGEINVSGSMRNLLYTKWAAVSKWYRYQPLDYIKEYFGVKIGLYFAWLGYYTYMLLLASIVGILCFIYSWKTLRYNTPSEEICSKENSIMMCPLCDHWCDYWELSETCLHARATYLFDNPTTVLFAIFMSFWATLFLELWKRYSAEITHRWDLTGFDVHEEHPRPQYLARLAHVRRKKINAVTNTEEPQVPYWRMKLPATILSFSVILLLVCLAIVAVLAVVLYRMSVLATLSVYGDEVTTSVAILFTTATAATINLCLIVVFNWMYTYLAEWLTERELLRTQTEFDDSLTLKIYLLQFVNYYASIFYIAFFKGKFIGYPGNYNRFFNFRQEECGFGGCLMELCIQLGIIMIGKQAVNTALEMAIPIFYKWLNSLKVRIGKQRNQSLKSKGQRFVKDLKLVEWGSRGLFPEYLEMVLQYGFVTIFVAAFPLAPFFALMNNILEMRLDAKKLLTFYRRPVSQRVRDIGIWYRILDSIGKLSVITNGFIIAFTSDFIPKLIYRLNISSDGSLNGYLNYTLAYFNTSDFQKGSEPFQSQYNVTICRYPDFREPPGSTNPYEKTTMYWLIMAARLAFVVIFENIVAIVMILVRWCIPDMSQDLRDQIRREAYITNEIIIKQETLRARMDRENEFAQDIIKPRSRIPKDTSDNSFVQLERLISSNLSGSQLDLFIHSERESNAAGNKSNV
nr:anoctamin-4-like isoform X6 [Aedes albopictus]